MNESYIRMFVYHSEFFFETGLIPVGLITTAIYLVAQPVKSACNVGDLGSIPESRRFPGEGNGNPLQCSCLENCTDGETWRTTVHGVAKSRPRLSNQHLLSRGAEGPQSLRSPGTSDLEAVKPGSLPNRPPPPCKQLHRPQWLTWLVLGLQGLNRASAIAASESCTSQDTAFVCSLAFQNKVSGSLCYHPWGSLSLALTRHTLSNPFSYILFDLLETVICPFLRLILPLGWRRQWHPTPVLLPGKSHGRRSLVGCSPWGR